MKSKSEVKLKTHCTDVLPGSGWRGVRIENRDKCHAKGGEAPATSCSHVGTSDLSYYTYKFINFKVKAEKHPFKPLRFQV